MCLPVLKNTIETMIEFRALEAQRGSKIVDMHFARLAGIHATAGFLKKLIASKETKAVLWEILKEEVQATLSHQEAAYLWMAVILSDLASSDTVRDPDVIRKIVAMEVGGIPALKRGKKPTHRSSRRSSHPHTNRPQQPAQHAAAA